MEPSYHNVQNNNHHLQIHLSDSSAKSKSDVKPREKFPCILDKLPKDQRHILYIDRSKWEQVTPVPKVDPYRFDNEKGYHDAMEKTLNFIAGDLGKRLDAQSLRELHDMCVDGVLRQTGEPFEKGYAPLWIYKLNIRRANPEAIKEMETEGIFAKLKKGEKANWDKKLRGPICIYDERDQKIKSLFTHPIQRRYVQDRINKLFDTYYNSLSLAKSDNEKLAAICKLCRAINMFHVFPDGNGRTVLWAMLPKLLMENGFCPAILEVPDRFAAGYYTIEEMVEQLHEGMNHFRDAVSQFEAEAEKNKSGTI